MKVHVKKLDYRATLILLQSQKSLCSHSTLSAGKYPGTHMLASIRFGSLTKVETNIHPFVSPLCSHIATLLFYALDCVQKDFKRISKSVTCTGRPMDWHKQPGEKHIEGTEVAIVQFFKPVHCKDISSHLKINLFSSLMHGTSRTEIFLISLHCQCRCLLLNDCALLADCFNFRQTRLLVGQHHNSYRRDL